MKLSTKLILGTFFAGIALTSCQKEVKDDSIISTENNTVADAAFGHLNDIVDTEVKIIEDNQYGTQKTTAIGDSCANISFTLSNDSSYIDSIIIDDGNLGCEWQGRTRKGKIITTQNTIIRRYKELVLGTPRRSMDKKS